MKIKPNLAFELLGTNIKLDPEKEYEVFPATNQPNWEKEGKVFVEGILLVKGEYTICNVANEENGN